MSPRLKVALNRQHQSARQWTLHYDIQGGFMSDCQTTTGLQLDSRSRAALKRIRNRLHLGNALATIMSAIAVFVLLPNVAMAGSDNISQTAVIDYIRHTITRDVARLGDRIDECARREKLSRTPVVDYDRLKQFDVGRAHAMKALLYLAQRNGRNCEGEARLRLAFDLEKLDIMLTKYGQAVDGINSEKTREINSSLVFPSADDIENGAVFFYLPSGAKQYLNDAVGKEPFDPIRTIQENRIAPHPPGS